MADPETIAAGVESANRFRRFRGTWREQWCPFSLPMADGRRPRFVSGEMRNPRRDLPRGLLIGVIGVIIFYLLVTYSCLRVLGIGDLASTTIPASEVMRHAFGERGAQVIACGIAISTVLAFLVRAF